MMRRRHQKPLNSDQQLHPQKQLQPLQHNHCQASSCSSIIISSSSSSDQPNHCPVSSKQQNNILDDTTTTKQPQRTRSSTSLFSYTSSPIIDNIDIDIAHHPVDSRNKRRRRERNVEKTISPPLGNLIWNHQQQNKQPTETNSTPTQTLQQENNFYLRDQTNYSTSSTKLNSHHHHHQQPKPQRKSQQPKKLMPALFQSSSNNHNKLSILQWALVALFVGCALALVGGSGSNLVDARITFEKMTNRDYSGITYYTIQNVSLFECLGWCKEETSCTSAVFSFVVNPFAALQETTCMLQNETIARQTAYLRTMPNGDQMTVVAHPQKATNLYFFNKIELPTEAVCTRLWAFERFPNRKLRQRDHASFHAPNKEACQAACMNEQRSVCRSVEYNYISQQCWLNGYDRRSPLILHLAAQASGSSSSSAGSNGLIANNNDLVEAPGTDYFENACLLGEDICTDSRIYDYAKIGLQANRVAHFVELNYYPDKEMLVKSQAGCVRACTIEHEFICRSILYRSSFKQGQPNCALYHLDQKTFPDGAETFMSHVMQPLLDSGETSAVYLEAVCNDTIGPSAQMISSTTSSLDRQTVGSSGNGGSTTITMPPTSITIMPSSTTPGGISVHAGNGNQNGHHMNNHHHNNNQNHSSSSSSSSMNEERFISSSSTLSPLGMTLGTSQSSTTIRLPTTFLPPIGNPSIPSNIQIADPFSGRPLAPSHITIGPPGSGGSSGSSSGMPMRVTGSSGGGSPMPSHIMISPAPPSRENTLSILGDGNGSSGLPTNLQISAAGSGPTHHDQNCDAHGFCYDVALKCTDTKMVVNVKTQRPFFGRIYALGRSETCNANIKNQNQFQLDMYLTGQECNTQSASGTYTNTIVLQHHNVVLTKADKVYHVRCTYETASRNVSFGMMPVKDMFEVDINEKNQETISITASSDAPLPKISILTSEGKEASTVRIGDRLTFRIEIPDNTPYGIFARSCVAMAKDARSTFEIVDENGCPVDHTIFPNFLPVANGNALESNYEAFRFTESYGVIFQCNVKYCIGKCEPVNCGIGRDSVEAWGRKKRSIGDGNDGSGSSKSSSSGTGKPLGDDMTLSREIVVLDLKEKDPNSPASAPSLGDGDASETQTGTSPSPTLSNGKKAHKSPLKSSSLDAQQQQSLNSMHCLSSQSLFVLICSIGLFFVLYVCVVAYFFARRDPKISAIKQQYH